MLCCIRVQACRTVPKLSRNDREDDHGEEAEEVEVESEEGTARRPGSQEEESSKEGRGQEIGREEEGQEAVSAAEVEAEGTSSCAGTRARTGADARDGGPLDGLRRRHLNLGRRDGDTPPAAFAAGGFLFQTLSVPSIRRARGTPNRPIASGWPGQ